MTTLPSAGYPSNAARTEAEMKQFFEDTLAKAREMLGGDAETSLTISSGSITPVRGIHSVDTESAAASDDLTTLAQTVLSDGAVVILRCANNARVVTVKNAAGGTGQMLLQYGKDAVLDNTRKWIALKRTGTSWEELYRFGFEDILPATAGSSTAYTLDPAFRPLALTTGLRVRGRLHTATGASPTLNVTGVGGSGLGAVGMRKFQAGSKVALAENDGASGQAFTATYDGTHWVVNFDQVVTPDTIGALKQGIHTIMLDVSGFTPQETDGPEAYSAEETTNDVMITGLAYDDTTEEKAWGDVVMPKSYSGEAITALVIWGATEGTASQSVVWGISLLVLSDNVAWDTAPGTEVNITDTYQSANREHISAVSGNITPAGTLSGFPKRMKVRLARKTGNASDTKTGDAIACMVVLFVPINAGDDS